MLSSGVAYAWPDVGRAVGADGWWDPFTAGKYTITALIVVTMICIGALLPPEEVRRLLRQWPSVLFGTSVQYLAMPSLAWLAVLLWRLDGDLRMGVLIVGCVPGAMASNVLTMVARGNVSYSVGLTTFATLLSPLVVPLGLKLTGGETISNQLLLDVCFNLVWTVVLPVLAGYGLCRLSARLDRWFQRGGELAANLAILWIIAAVVGRQRSFLQQAESSDVLSTMTVALLFINVAGYLAGYAGGWGVGLDVRRRRALAIEVGMQNAGVGTQLAILILGPNSTATIPTAMYTFGCMLTGTLLAQWFGRSEPVVDAMDGSAAATRED
jgi:BASS family bile acid:Na+ symporter